jgi:hypothetical protein
MFNVDNVLLSQQAVSSIHHTSGSWSAESCRQRIQNLMNTAGDAAAFWLDATAWYTKQSEQGETQEQRAAACWEALCTAWNELRGDDWANAQKAPAQSSNRQAVVPYAVQLFHGQLITSIQSKGD